MPEGVVILNESIQRCATINDILAVVLIFGLLTVGFIIGTIYNLVKKKYTYIALMITMAIATSLSLFFITAQAVDQYHYVKKVYTVTFDDRAMADFMQKYEIIHQSGNEFIIRELFPQKEYQ